MTLAIPDKIEKIFRSISDDKAELSQLNEKYRCAVEEAENRKRAAEQLGQEISLLRSRIEDRKKRGMNPSTDDLEKLIEELDRLSAQVARAEDDKRLINLEIVAKTAKTDHPKMEKEDVLAVQKAMDEKRAALERVESAIEAERAKADTAFSVAESSTAMALQTRLENLLADAIDGPAQSAEIEKVREQFAKAKSAMEMEWGAARELARHAVAGLERKRQQLQEELDRLIDAHRTAIWLHLQTRMAARRTAYIEAGRALVEAFAQMRALELLSRDVAGNGRKVVFAFPGGIAQLELPEPHGVKDPALRATPVLLDLILKNVRAEFDPIKLKP